MSDELGPCARRAIDLRRIEGGVEAWLEDDFHHFGIRMYHDGAVVTAVEGMAERYPRDTCPGAVDILRELVGMPLDERCTALGAHTDMRWHCTHMYDLLGLAIAHAATGREHRRYDAVVPDREVPEHTSFDSPIGGATSPVLYRDGERVLAWAVQGNDIVGPDPYAGISMGRGFRAWTEALDVDEAEAAHVLRRAILIALGRLVNLHELPPGGVEATRGVCHSFQPQVARLSKGTIASSRDYSDRPQDLLANIRD